MGQTSPSSGLWGCPSSNGPRGIGDRAGAPGRDVTVWLGSPHATVVGVDEVHRPAATGDGTDVPETRQVRGAGVAPRADHLDRCAPVGPVKDHEVLDRLLRGGERAI